MRVLIFHGYLLRGTGSNVYNTSLARALRDLGHDVHLLCQDRHAAGLDWVERAGDWDGGELAVEQLRKGAGAGSITVYRPDISGLLPVYVRDRYQGFEVKTFPELSDTELQRYLEANVGAAAEVVTSLGGVDAALANHLVMGPVILARAGLGTGRGGPGLAVKVHGSALEYTVKPNPRFLAEAREGIDAASAVLVGSRHTAESLWKTIDDETLPERTRLGPPGVDTSLFTPLPREQSGEAIERLAAAVEAAPADTSFGREAGRAATALRAYAGAEGPRVLYVGKLIPGKGVDLLLGAWAAVAAAHPGARLLVAGFGEQMDELVTAAAGDATIGFSGRLEHDEVAPLMAAADALVVPSTFPEAFGMVAAEAAAAGTLPVCAGHSGLAEVTAALAGRLDPALGGLLSFPLDGGESAAIARRLDVWLSLAQAERDAARVLLSETAGELWSWTGVARGVLDAAAGRLDRLLPVADC